MDSVDFIHIFNTFWLVDDKQRLSVYKVDVYSYCIYLVCKWYLQHCLGCKWQLQHGWGSLQRKQPLSWTKYAICVGNILLDSTD